MTRKTPSQSTRCLTISASIGSQILQRRLLGYTGKTPRVVVQASQLGASSCRWPHQSSRGRFFVRQRNGLRPSGRTCSTGTNLTRVGTLPLSNNRSYLPERCTALRHGEARKVCLHRKHHRQGMESVRQGSFNESRARKLSLITIETLLKRNLREVFGGETPKRREAIAELWTEDCVFIDHNQDQRARWTRSCGRDITSATSGLRFQRASACRSTLRKRALGLELWTTGPEAYQGRRCSSCSRWSHLSDADVP